MRNLFLFIGLITILLFTFLGALLIYYGLNELPFLLFVKGKPWWYQIPVGVAVGALSGVLANRLMKTDVLKDMNDYYTSMFAELTFTKTDAILVSVCAGIGEEFLFRAGIQSWMIQWLDGRILLGVVLSAVVFVLLHGYYRLRKPLYNIYGLYITGVVVAFGYLYLYVGLISAIVAHTVYDIFLLLKLAEDIQRLKKDKELEPSEN